MEIRQAPVCGTIRTLLVDDEPLARRGLVLRLAAHPDVEVVGQCGDGAAAVAAVAELQPDLLLLDVQMPGMDGFEVTRALRSQPNRQLARVPIVALTALAMPGDRERCLMAGMTEYLTKPVRLAELTALVQRLCRDGRGGTAS